MDYPNFPIELSFKEDPQLMMFALIPYQDYHFCTPISSIVGWKIRFKVLWKETTSFIYKYIFLNR